MRNKYSREFELEMYDIANKHTLDELLNISITKYGYNINKNKLRNYLGKRQIIYKDYNISKSRDMGKYISIGTEYIKPDGMTLIKVDKNKWQYKQRYIYEKYYNVKLTNNDYIIFLDHNRSNFDISNLKRISRRESSILSNQHLFSNNANVTKVGIETAKLIIKLKEMRENMNIYAKQMKDLKLNPKEYAELTGIPYELVKDVIYDKKGNYSDEIKEFLRKNIFNKHQEIENDKENMKLKDNNNYLEWYKNEYNLDMLKQKLNIESIIEFERKYVIMINDKKASHWYYSCILPKKFLDKVSNSTIYEFAEQLYDILVNGNEQNYINDGTINEERKPKLNIDNDIVKWAKNYDIKAFMDKYNITNRQLSEELSIGYSTVCLVVAKQYFGKSTLQKIKNYIEQKENNHVEVKDVIVENEIIEEPKDVIEEQPEIIEEQLEPIKENVVGQEDILRRLLINRLTEEEKELIKLFGGKIC